MKIKVQMPMNYLRIIMLMPFLFWGCNKKEDPAPPNPCDDSEEWYEAKRANELYLRFGSPSNTNTDAECRNFVRAIRAWYDKMEKEKCPVPEKYQTPYDEWRAIVSLDIDAICSQGSIVFYENADYGCDVTTVTVNGHGSKSITQYVISGSPECGEDGLATWTLPPGNYSFNASCGSLTWSGNFTIEPWVCLAFFLQNSSP